MHRSGTSWLARTLNLCGVDLGQRAEWQGPDNPSGFWEDRLALLVNEEILQRAGATWDKPPSVIDTALDPGVIALLTKGFTGSVVAWKDPRFSLTFPAYREAFPDVRLVAPLRHPEAVAVSLAKRNGMPKEQALALWADYNSRLFEYGADFVLFPEGTGVRRLVESLGMGWTKAAEDWFDSGLVHYSVDDTETKEMRATQHAIFSYLNIYHWIADTIKE
jgi:hypothetical protein